MTNPSFNAAAQVSQTRASLTKRIGEIIEDIIGDDRVRALFDAAGKHPDEYAGKPTGLIALDLKVITPNTKTALLVAQAAERTYNLAEQAASLAANQLIVIKSKQQVDTSAVKSFDHPDFKFVGSERDPVVLQKAQGTWMAAQLLLNNEVEAINTAITNPGYVAAPSSRANKGAEGFKNAAVELYTEASKILAAEGHADAAQKLSAVSQNLAANVKQIDCSPSETMKQLVSDYNNGSQQLDIAIGQGYTGSEKIVDVYMNLARLTDLNEKAAAVPVVTPKAAP